MTKVLASPTLARCEARMQLLMKVMPPAFVCVYLKDKSALLLSFRTKKGHAHSRHAQTREFTPFSHLLVRPSPQSSARDQTSRVGNTAWLVRATRVREVLGSGPKPRCRKGGGGKEETEDIF